MSNKINTRGVPYTPATVLFLICVLWLNGGLLRFSASFNAYVFLGLFLVGTCCAIFETELEYKSLYNSGLVYGIIFFLSLLPTSWLVYNTLEGEMIKVLYALILLVIQLFLRYKTTAVQKLFVFAILIDCILININTLIVLATTDNLARKYASGGDAVLATGNSIFLLGGYGYIYALVFSIIFIFIKRNNIKDLPRLQKYIVLAFTVTSIITIIDAQYTIAILILLLGVIGAFFTSRGLKLKNILAICVLAVVLICVGFEIIEYLAYNNVLGFIVTNRLHEILNLFSGSLNLSGDLALRFYLYTKTIRYLPECFLVGTYESFLDPRLVLGWHTEWFDRLACFGIFRYGIFITFLIKSIKFSLPKTNHNYSIFIICLILIGTINPILVDNFYVTMFILVPFIFADNA